MRSLVLAFVPVLFALPARAQITVTSLSPTMNASNVSPNTQVVVEFDRAVNPATLPPNQPHFHISGSVKGPIAGTLALENGNQRLRFTPSGPFEAGEIVHVELDRFVQAQDATFLRAGGWSWSFRVAAGPALRSFQEIDSMTVRTTPGVSARVYGGGLADFDQDGWVDIAGVCEDSNDVRMFLNQGTGTGLFDDFLPTTFATGSTPSPNEHADLNGDGLLDMVTANTGGSNVSVLLGNGNGTFGPKTDYTIGNGPHGIAVLDVDGDGDLDIATANTGAGNVGLLRNNGAGVFGSLSTFDGGGSGEYAIAAGDYNNDGLIDLVVGTSGSNAATVLLSNGNGTFVMQTPTNAGGSPWMMQAGDLNNDGNLDISIAHVTTGSVMFGNGLGGLGAAQVHGAGSNAVATDLGDLDGDGDLDWVLSFFGSAEFRVFRNNGAGTFAFDQSFGADANGSCAGLVDIDGDRDIDMLLFDEIADTIRVMRNLNGTFQQLCSPGLAGVVSCPCGNPPSGSGRGCNNFGASSGGASLNGSGVASLGSDSVVLSAANENLTSLTIFWTGQNLISPPGTAHGAGVRCVSVLNRLYSGNASGGAIARPGGSDPSVSARSAAVGAAITAGQTRYYFTIYRDNLAAGPCGNPTSNINLSNALGVTWAP
ncbi:MAG: FG-GAP-like repeat-containing protein [Planctomycetota bacterium]